MEKSPHDGLDTDQNVWCIVSDTREYFVFVFLYKQAARALLFGFVRSWIVEYWQFNAVLGWKHVTSAIVGSVPT